MLNDVEECAPVELIESDQVITKSELISDEDTTITRCSTCGKPVDAEGSNNYTNVYFLFYMRDTTPLHLVVISF